MGGDAIGPVGASPGEIHAWWFGDALRDPAAAQRRLEFWFRSSSDVDDEIRRRFAPVLAAAAEGRLAEWEAAPQSRLALILVLDQFPRNIHRGTPAAFKYDPQALAVSRRGLAGGDWLVLTVPERAFLLMPFQHAEDRVVQRESVALFERLLADAPPEWREIAEANLKYARLHLEIVERFGRFPHRNAILGRASTPEEIDYLRTTTELFGQTAK